MDATSGARSAYPPLGFKPVCEGELGNGDYYGLYWPYGRENLDPVVCDMLHDQSGLQVAFSNIQVFLQYLDLNEGFRGDNEVEDLGSVIERFQAARQFLQGQPAEAVSLLTSICADFPECAEYWFALAGQLRRLGDDEGSARAAIRAFASNWVFGLPPKGTLKLLQNARGLSSVASDPLISRSIELSMNFGGARENPVYGILKDCIDSYLKSDNPLPGLLLNQNFGYMMAGETTAFQDRHGFKVEHWLEGHRQLCLTHLGDDRQSIN